MNKELFSKIWRTLQLNLKWLLLPVLCHAASVISKTLRVLATPSSRSRGGVQTNRPLCHTCCSGPPDLFEMADFRHRAFGWMPVMNDNTPWNGWAIENRCHASLPHYLKGQTPKKKTELRVGFQGRSLFFFHCLPGVAFAFVEKRGKKIVEKKIVLGF